jgi:integral membrane protein
MKGIPGAAVRYKVMAYVTGVILGAAFTWMLVLIALWIGAGNGLGEFFSSNDQKPTLYSILWIVHGWAYFIYLVVGVDLAFRLRYGIGRTVLILLAGTVPFMSFVSEHYVRLDIERRKLPSPAS